jgi:hypothetical protein
MNDVLRAMAISAGLLLPVVAAIIFISIVTVKRGEVSMHGGHGLPGDLHPVAEAAAPVKGAKAALPVSNEISVAQILIYGVGLFVLTIILLMAISLLNHM